MGKIIFTLKCGCIPDASGFGYCGDCTKKLRQKIWSEMSEDKKNYDRHFAPDESKELDDYFKDVEFNTCCSCHINPPCSYCVNKDSE